MVEGELSEYEKIKAANVKEKEELLRTLQGDWQEFKESEGLVTGKNQKGAKKLKAVEREAANTEKSAGTSCSSNDIVIGLRKVNKNHPEGDVPTKSVKGSRAVLVNWHEEERGDLASKAPSETFSDSSTRTSLATTETDSTISPYSSPFTEGEDILVHLEDGLIYLGVVAEVEEEQGKCLVRFGDCTERWSSFNELQRLGEISDDECTPPSTTEPPDPFGFEEEPSEIKIHSEPSVEIPKEGQSGDKQFSCSYCDYFCSRSSVLKKHTRIHTGEKPYSCTHCGYSCAQSSDLKRHMRAHTGEKPYICTDCGYSCAGSNTLKRHMRIHTGEKPYSCTRCDHSCAQSTDLKRHMRVHTGEKPYSCTHCDYTCSHSEQLKRHMRIHTGEKPYSCSECGYSCAQSIDLKRHMKIHTGENFSH